MLRCRDVAEKANDYIDGNVGWWTRIQMALHLAMCNACKAYVRQFQRTVIFLKAVAERTPTVNADSVVDNVLNADARSKSTGV